MPLVDKNLASGTNDNASLREILRVPTGLTSVIYSFILTNLTTEVITVDLYFNDGSDRLLESVKIPAGLGNAKTVEKLSGLTLDSGNGIKIQAASANAFNFKLNGAERT